MAKYKLTDHLRKAAIQKDARTPIEQHKSPFKRRKRFPITGG